MPESQHLRMKRVARRTVDATYALEWGVISAYDPATHSAKAIVQPDGRETGYLDISAAPGLRLAPTRGQSCKVAFDRGVATSIAELHYGGDGVPSAGLALQDEAHFGGPVVFYSTLLLVPSRTTGAPTAGTHAQGELMMDAAGALHVCIAAGTPGTWKTVSVV